MDISKIWDLFGDASDNIRGIGAGLGLLALVSQGALWLFMQGAGMSYWITYHDMVVDGDQIAGKSFSVKSYASHNRSVDISYTDVLQCKDAGIYINFSSQPFAIENHFPPDTEQPVEDTGYGDGEDVYVSPWRYAAATPDYRVTCRIRGIQKISVLYGVTKENVVVTNEFEFIPKDELEK